MQNASALLQRFLEPDADYQLLSRELQPSEQDLLAVFSDAQFARQAMRIYTKAWEDGYMTIRPKPGQVDLLLWSATAEELRSGEGDADKFPGGYDKVAHLLKDGVRVFRWKFVRPGSPMGMAFDGLYYANGHWFIAPKPWRALPESPG